MQSTCKKNEHHHSTTIDDESFKSAIQRGLHKSGIIASVTAQLRKHIYDATANQGRSSQYPIKPGQSLEQKAIRSLILEYLLHDNLQLTASVLASDSGFLDDNYLSREDSLKIYGIAANSAIHSILTKIRDGDIGNKSYTSSTIHLLLLHSSSLSSSIDTSKSSASCQTAISSVDCLKAREHLDSRLEKINIKYGDQIKRLNCNTSNFEQVIQDKLKEIQKECEERAQRELEEKVKQFQAASIASMRKEEEEKRHNDIIQLHLEVKKDYDRKLQRFIKKCDDMKMEYEKNDRDRQIKLLKEREVMRNEIHKVEQREFYIENKLHLERKKLEIEERRVQQILQTANDKLEHAEKREKALKEELTIEYDKIRTLAKQSSEDASHVTMQRNDCYSKSLDELNSLRKELSDMMSENEMKTAKVSEMIDEREVLLQDLDDCKQELQQLRELIKLREVKYSDDTLQITEQLRETELRLKIADGSLLMVNKEKECEKQSYSTRNNQLESTLKIFQQKLSEARLDIEKTKVEKSVLIVELEETKRLLKQSLEALRCKAGETYNDSMINIEIGKHKSSEKFRNDMMHSSVKTSPQNKMVSVEHSCDINSNPIQEIRKSVSLDHENNPSMDEKFRIKSETCADKVHNENQVIFEPDTSEMTLSVIECVKYQPTDDEHHSLHSMSTTATWDGSSMKHSLTTNRNQNHLRFQTECKKGNEHNTFRDNSKCDLNGERSHELSTPTQVMQEVVSNDEIPAKFTSETVNQETAPNVYDMSDFDPESTVDFTSNKGNESASLNSLGRCMEVDVIRDTKFSSDFPLQQSNNSACKALSSESSVSFQSSNQLESSSSVGIEVYNSNRNGNQGDWW